MHRFRSSTWVHATSAVAAAFLALGLFAPSARASCGDYVSMASHGKPAAHTSSGGQHSSGTQSEQRPAKSELETPPAPRPTPCQRCPHAPGEPGKAPCRGPACSGDPAPLTVPATTVELVRDHWAAWWCAFQLADFSSTPHAFLTEQSGRIHRVSPVFHPPRIA